MLLPSANRRASLTIYFRAGGDFCEWIGILAVVTENNPWPVTRKGERSMVVFGNGPAATRHG